MDFQLSRDHFRENHFSGFFSSRSCFLRLTKMNDHFAGFFSRRRPRSFYCYFFSPEPVIIFVDHFAGFSPVIWISLGVRGAAETHSKTEFEANNAGSRHGFGIKPVSMANTAIPWGRGGGGEEGSKGMGFGRRPLFPVKALSQSRRLWPLCGW